MTEFETFTLPEVLAVLRTYHEAIRGWDPMLNGQQAADLEGLNPNVPEQLQQRKLVIERHQWSHDLAVGQRMATSSLEYCFIDAVKERRIAFVDAQPWEGLRPCCERYLASLASCDAEWTKEARMHRDGTHPLLGFVHDDGSVYGHPPQTPEWHAAIYDKCVADNAVMRATIESGGYTVNGHRQCCPWDDRLDHGPFMASYQRLSEYWQAGGRTEDLTLGPIEVIPNP